MLLCDFYGKEVNLSVSGFSENNFFIFELILYSKLRQHSGDFLLVELSSQRQQFEESFYYECYKQISCYQNSSETFRNLLLILVSVNVQQVHLRDERAARFFGLRRIPTRSVGFWAGGFENFRVGLSCWAGFQKCNFWLCWVRAGSEKNLNPLVSSTPLLNCKQKFSKT